MMIIFFEFLKFFFQKKRRSQIQILLGLSASWLILALFIKIKKKKEKILIGRYFGVYLFEEYLLWSLSLDKIFI